MDTTRSTLALLTRTLRGLRARLTLSYIILFGLVLVSVGFVFRQAISAVLNQQAEHVLAEEWGAVKGYLRFTAAGEPVWAHDPEDTEEAFTVERLRRILMLTDATASVLELSTGYNSLGPERKSDIYRILAKGESATVLRQDARGDLYLVRMGPIRDQGHTYFLALGYPMGDTLRIPDRFMRVYFLMLPIMLLAIAILGWYAAGRSLLPVQQVAEATRTVSTGNLSLRLVPHGTDDELDMLIGTFNSMLERLEQNFAQIRQFTLDASHELRTPITAIRGQLEVALLTANTPDQYRAAIVAALHDAERMGQVVKSLLMLAQAESGQVTLDKKRLNLSPLVEELAAQFRLAAEDKHLTVECVLPAVCEADVDRVQFERMVMNLLSNAVKFTPPGGVIRTTLTAAGDEIFLTVSDTGPGIPAEHLPHVFERFYRVRGSEEGAGLGLAFVAWIVRAHDGRIMVHSEPDQGSAFQVVLPAGAPQGPFRVLRDGRPPLAA
jgi:heavy metal sensor kinase